MLREEAIAFFKDMNECTYGNLEAVEMAIKALEQEPRKDEVILTKEEYGELVSSEFDNGYAKGYREALEQEPCDDCVRRQEVLDILKDEWNTCLDANDAMQESIDTIEALKPATPQPKMGRWIKHDIDGGVYYDCSRCGCVAPCTETADSFIWKLSNFCPDCGAKMEGDENG